MSSGLGFRIHVLGFRGPGHEFALNFDMRFGVYGVTKICFLVLSL